MRKEPEEHCLSTLEACGEALKILEGVDGNGPKIQKRLLTVLTKHVELHLKNAREASQSRHNRDTTSRDTKLKRAKEIERSIYGDTSPSGSTSTTTTTSTSSHQDGDVRTIATTTTIDATTTRLLKLDDDKDGKSSAVTIRRLTHEDIPLIDTWWDNGGTSKSLMTLTRCIDSDYDKDIGATLGIVDENDKTKLIACVVRYESGPLGILHVVEEHRKKGYGTALLKEATRILSERKKAYSNNNNNNNHGDHPPPLESSCEAFIKDGNIASEQVFSKVGWVRENPNAKKGHGRRRANRKWIFPS